MWPPDAPEKLFDYCDLRWSLGIEKLISLIVLRRELTGGVSKAKIRDNCKRLVIQCNLMIHIPTFTIN